MSMTDKRAPLGNGDIAIEEQPGPAFQFYARDWLTGQATTRMTGEQKGAFIDLLSHAWLSRPPCSLPDDDEVLAKLCGLGRARWKKIGALVRAQFVAGSDGLLRNRKQEAVYRELLDFRARRSDSGRKGAEARWHRNGGALRSDSDGNAEGYADGMRTRCEDDANSMAKAWPASASASAKEEGKNGAETALLTPSQLIELWNGAAGATGLPRVQKLTATRRRHAQQRLGEHHQRAYWESVIRRIAASAFCRGENTRGWKADVDFILKPDTHVRVLEGKYDNTPKSVCNDGRNASRAAIPSVQQTAAELAAERKRIDALTNTRAAREAL
jgi:uncharacterized protein YdaU (DUF1376 family)